jgi:hypothetical protein
MATSKAREAIEKHRRQQAGDGDALFSDDRSLFSRGTSIAVTLTATGRDIHDLDDDMDARVHVYSDAIVIVPGGEGDE